MCPQSNCKISVIIPTRDRGPLLIRCLEALADQTLDPRYYEVIVIDDGSTDQTKKTVKGVQTSTPLTLKYLSQKTAGPSAARNRGIKKARGQIVLITGDDYIAAPDLIAQHLSWHQERYPAENTAVLGYAERHPDFEHDQVTEWTEDEGLQFYYGQIRHGDEVSFFHFITCNISLKKSFFDRFGPFDEDFTFAMGEDAELGFRLFTAGLRLFYNQEARAYHHHPADRNFIRQRLRIFGEMQVLQDEKCPGIIEVRGYDIDPFKRLIHFLYGLMYPLLINVRHLPARFRKQLLYLELGILGHRSIREGCRQGLQKLYPVSTRSDVPSVLIFVTEDLNCFYRSVAGIRHFFPDSNLILVGSQRRSLRIMAFHPEIQGCVVCPHPDRPLWYSTQKNFREQLRAHDPAAAVLLTEFDNRFRYDHYLTALAQVGSNNMYQLEWSGQVQPLKPRHLFSNAWCRHKTNRDLLFEIWDSIFSILHHSGRLVNLILFEPLRWGVNLVRARFFRDPETPASDRTKR